VRRVVPDTNVWIDWLNTGRHETVLLSRDSVKYLSAIVLIDLYAGAGSPGDRRHVRRLHHVFQRTRRIILPTVATIADAGQLLHHFRWLDGEGRSRQAGFSHNVLLALSARQVGATVLTSNAADFERIRALARFELEVLSPAA
jgi:predicted nucleic acid-binding protein